MFFNISIYSEVGFPERLNINHYKVVCQLTMSSPPDKTGQPCYRKKTYCTTPHCERLKGYCNAHELPTTFP